MNKYFDIDKIKELYPEVEEMLIPPMLIHKGTDSQLKNCDNGEWFAQLKKDGILAIFYKTEHYSYLFTRTISKKTGLPVEKSANVPHIIEAFHDIPPNTIIIGELYYPGKTSKDCTSILGCLPEKAFNRQFKEGYGPIHYYVYDVLGYNGTSLLKYDNWTRYQVLCKIYEKFQLFNQYTKNKNNIKLISFPSYIELAAATEEGIYQSIGKALAAGEEGMVVKKKTALYEPGKRPMTMLKAKQIDNVDVVIIGFKDPVIEYTGKEIENWQYWVNGYDGSHLPVGLHYGEDIAVAVTKHHYYGWKNAIEIGAYDEQGNIKSIGTIASGLTDFIREDMSLHPENYLNKVCEIQCMMKDNTEHTLRHGFFLQIRYDKNPEDCKLSDIFN